MYIPGKMPGREKELLTMDASTFPISLTYHLVFALIAGIFFLVQFIRLRRPYQLLLAIGILASLLIHVGDPHNKVWFNTIGRGHCIIQNNATAYVCCASIMMNVKSTDWYNSRRTRQ